MKRVALILIVVMVVVSLVGCASISNATGNVGKVHSKYIDMEEIESTDAYIIYRDTTTDVLYLAVRGYNSSGLTPIYNSDGTLKTFSEVE